MTTFDDPRATPAPPHPVTDAVRFAVVDVETSGLSARRHQVLQVAVVVVDAAGEVVDSFESLVRPRYGLLSRVGPRRVHGITRWSLRNAPRPHEVLVELAPRLAGAVVVGHNVAFDVAFLEQMAHRAGVPMVLGPQLCTLRLSRSLDPERRLRHRLSDLCDRYDVHHRRPHNAWDDAAATAELLHRLLAEAGVVDRAGLDRLLRGQRPPRSSAGAAAA